LRPTRIRDKFMKKVLVLFTLLAFTLLGVDAQTDQSPWLITGNAGTTDANFIGTTDKMPIIFKTRNTERMRLLLDKPFLGIGVSTPLATLHLHYQNGMNPPISQKLLQLTTNATGNADGNGFAVFSDYNTKEILFKQQEGANFKIEGPGGGLVVAPTGKIGFGTDTPEKMVHVVGNLLIDRTADTPSSLQFRHPDSNPKGLPPNDLEASYQHYWDIYSDPYGLRFYTVSTNSTYNAIAQRMVIGSTGLVGIGVAAPQAKLDVAGAVKATSANISETVTANALSAQIADIAGTITAKDLKISGNSYLNGSVEIGTATQQAQLNVNGVFTAKSANITGNLTVKEGPFNLALGNAYSKDLSFGTSYVGFNAIRNNGTWKLAGDGANNGGGVIWSSIWGDLYFASLPVTGAGMQTLTDAQVKNNIKLHITNTGKLKAKEIEVTLANWPDFVFGKDYKLPSLSEVEQFVTQNQHLPNVPSAAEVEANGVNVGEMNAKLLQKVEELTLYIIQIEKRLSEVEGK